MEKIKCTDRIQSPFAKSGTYNGWNYNKLKIFSSRQRGDDVQLRCPAHDAITLHVQSLESSMEEIRVFLVKCSHDGMVGLQRLIICVIMRGMRPQRICTPFTTWVGSVGCVIRTMTVIGLGLIFRNSLVTLQMSSGGMLYEAMPKELRRHCSLTKRTDMSMKV